jgi:hypothetical protein
MVPEIPLDDYVKNFRYIPPEDHGETTMLGETQALEKEAPAVSDAPAPIVTEATNAANSDPISDTEDVDERLGLAELAPNDEHRDRPRFLDLNEPTAPLAGPEVRVPAIGGPSFLGLDYTTPLAAPSPHSLEAAEPSRRVWTWVAVGALLIFVALGVLEWRSQGNETNFGPVEVVKTRVRNMWRGSSPAPQAAGSAEGEAAKPTMQVEEQPKPTPEDQSVAANASAPSSTMAGNHRASDTSPAANAANSPQTALPLTGAQPSAGPKAFSAAPGGSVSAPQPAAEQKATQSKATPLSNRSQAANSETTGAAHPSAAAPKPKAAADELSVPTRKTVSGQEEMAKANDASDAAAAAAWLWKATAKGNPEAPVRLADMYVKGDGVPRSCEQAFVLLRAAADNGNAQARARLAQISNSGTCSQRNR